MKEQTKRTIAAAISLFGMLVISDGAFADGVESRVRGTVTSLTGADLLVKSREGASVPIALKPDWKVVGIGKASVGDIKVGDFVGIASLPQADEGDGALVTFADAGAIIPECDRFTHFSMFWIDCIHEADLDPMGTSASLKLRSSSPNGDPHRHRRQRRDRVRRCTAKGTSQ